MASFDNWSVLRHLLADGSQLLAYDHHGGVNVDKRSFEIPFLFVVDVLKAADIDKEFRALTEVDGELAQHLFIGGVLCVNICSDELEFDGVSAPESLHVW
ncbi:hypothetical protein D3C87_1251710 [compost metagenome]